MFHVDTSVALAHLLSDDRRPPVSFWDNSLVSSRLLEYELWNRVRARNLALSHGEAAQGIVGRLALLELSPRVLARALGAFPIPLRTLDALHLASLDYLRGQRQAVELASYDHRMTAAARAMDIPVHDLRV